VNLGLPVFIEAKKWWWKLELQDVQSSSQIVTTNKPTSNFLQAPFLSLNQQCQSTEGNVDHSMRLMKKRSERCKHCALAVVRRSQKFSPRRRPLPRGAGPPKFNQLEKPLPTNPVWWGSMHAISSYRGNRPTNKQTHTSTDRADYNTLCR